MKAKAITYWIATALVVLVMTVSGFMAVAHVPAMMKAEAHLGYPTYFFDLLGAGKLAGVCVLLVPRVPRLKEWAYVAFGITVFSGTYSHLQSGDGLEALEPLATFLMLAISYLTRPADRKL